MLFVEILLKIFHVVEGSEKSFRGDEFHGDFSFVIFPLNSRIEHKKGSRN